MKSLAFFFLLSCLLVSTQVWAQSEAATAAQVAQLLQYNNPFKSKDISPEFVRNAASISTKKLGAENSSWNPSHPKWESIYEKVYDDTVNDLKPFSEYMQSHAQSDASKIVQSHLSASDANKILEFLASPQGRVFVDFNDSVDTLLADRDLQPEPVASGKDRPELTLEQKNNFVRMLNQARLFQMMTIFKSTDSAISDGAAGAALAASVVLQYPAQLTTLYSEFADELGPINDFNKTSSERNYLKSMALVAQETGWTMMQIQSSHSAAIQKHQVEWTALYQQEVMAN